MQTDRCFGSRFEQGWAVVVCCKPGCPMLWLHVATMLLLFLELFIQYQLRDCYLIMHYAMEICHWAAKWLLKLRQWLSSATGYLKHSQDDTLQDFLFSFCGYSLFVSSTTATWFKLVPIQRNCIDMPCVPECHRSCWGHLSKENRLWHARTEWVTLVYPLVCWAWGRHNFASGGAVVK